MATQSAIQNAGSVSSPCASGKQSFAAEKEAVQYENGKAPSTPFSICTKNYFQSEEAALEFEKANRQKNGFHQQYAYKCEYCTGYHLSSKTAEEHELSKSTQAASLGNAIPPARRTRRNQLEIERLNAQVAELHKAGMSSREIAERLGATPNQIYYALQKVGLSNVHTKIASVDLESIQTEEERLEAQLNALRLKKQQMLDAKKLKVEWYTNNGSVQPGKAVSIRKEGEHFNCTVETAKELITALEELVTRALPEAEAVPA